MATLLVIWVIFYIIGVVVAFVINYRTLDLDDEKYPAGVIIWIMTLGLSLGSWLTAGIALMFGIMEKGTTFFKCKKRI